MRTAKGKARGGSKLNNNSRTVVRNIEERDVGTIRGKSPKQNLTKMVCTLLSFLKAALHSPTCWCSYATQEGGVATLHTLQPDVTRYRLQ